MNVTHPDFGITMPNLSHFFSPSSIAVIGASERDSSMGGLVVKNLKKSAYPHELYAVNVKKYATVFGLPCFQNLNNISAPIDLCIICVPLSSIPRVLRQMGELNIKAALILTGGLARQPNLAKDSNRSIERLAKKLNIRVMGPNCLGVLVPDAHLNASYAHVEALSGNTAYIGHSAALGSSLLDWAGARGIGFSHFLTLGASADIRISDVVDFLASDRRVKTILVQLEQIRDANRLLIALRAASRSKKVLAIRTHTLDEYPPGVIHSQKIDEEFFSRAGVLQVDTIDGLFNGLEILSRSKRLHRRNLAIVSNGLGTGMLARQYLLANKGELAPPVTKSNANEDKWFRSEMLSSPAILPPQSTADEYVNLLKRLEKEQNVGAILIIHSPNVRSESSELAKYLLPYVKKSRRLILTCFLGGLTTQKGRTLFDQAGLLSFDSPTEAVNAFLSLARHDEAQDRLKETPSTDALDFDRNLELARKVIYTTRKSGRDYLTWPESRKLLRCYGFKLVDSTFGANFEELCLRLTPRFFPAALRLVHENYCYPFAYQQSPAARWRGSKVELLDEQALKKAYKELIVEKEARYPNSKILGWAVQPMRRKIDALQFSLGMTRDPTYGPLVFFGEGGSHADMLSDRQVALVPLNSALALQLIERSHGYQVLCERSNQLEHDVQILTRHVVAMSQMVVDLPRLAGVEVNVLLQNLSEPLVLGVAVNIGIKVKPALNPYPKNLEEFAVLKNGRDVLLRPIRGEDEPLLKSFFAEFDSESLRLRFFYSRHNFEHLELAAMSQIDYRREMVFVAVFESEIISEMRLWFDVNKQELEFAIMVSPHYQGLGLASIMMKKTILYAESIYALKIVADVLPENTSMLGLAKRFDFSIDHEDDIIRIEKTLK